MFPLWILLELRVIEVVSGDNWSYTVSRKKTTHLHAVDSNFLSNAV